MVLCAIVKTPPAASVIKIPPTATVVVETEQVSNKMDGGGHVSLPRIAEERDQLLQQQQLQQQQPMVIPVTATIDKPTKSTKTINGGGSRYFFNRKYKHGNKDNQQQQFGKIGSDVTARLGTGYGVLTKNVPPPPPPFP